jgi:uncharacterized protein YcbK (DUF882 family)
MIKYPTPRFFNELDRKLQNALNVFDRVCEREVFATSGLRSSEKNAEVGGVSTSSHLKGLALDLACSDSQTRYDIIRCAIIADFKRIGIGKTHIHLDLDPDKIQPVIFFDNY